MAVLEIFVCVGIVLIVGLIALVIGLYNSIITLLQRVENAWSQIDVQLKKRFDLVPNLVETVKGYAKHESGTFEKVTQARAAVAQAGSVEDKINANNMLTGALKTLFAVTEAYPDLKANQNFLSLQEQLTGIEEKIAYARQFYNDSVMEFNTTIMKVPAVFIANMFGFKQKPYYEVEGEEKEAIKKAPTVKF